jgi:hypothetical protein
MKMAIYRQRQAMLQMEHTACIRGATTENDLDLLDLAVRLAKPILMGLAGETTIIKPYVEGDETLTFEALYDTTITLTDLQRMKQARVTSPEEIPPQRFRVDLVTTCQGVFDIGLMISAANDGDVRRKLHDLFETDALFRDALHDAFVKALRQDGEVIYSIRECSGVGEVASPDIPTWDFVNLDG